MAINKVVNKSSKSHAGLRNVLEYVLRVEKVKGRYIDIIGPYPSDTIDYDAVYRTWLEEKRLWGKDSGRMYAHNIISFHKDEAVTPEQAKEIGRHFTERFFTGHQSLIAVHEDKDHLHIHIITNSVSFVDGSKLHQTKHDLELQKMFTNELCQSMGLSVTRKGHHFDSSPMEEGTILSWDKNKYKLLSDNSKKSYIADCMIAVAETVSISVNQEEFISKMKDRGWIVRWKDNKKHITFLNKDGKKVRDNNLSKTFSVDISKEGLTSEFNRTAKLKQYTEEINNTGYSICTAPPVSDNSDASRIFLLDCPGTAIIESKRPYRRYSRERRVAVRDCNSEKRNIISQERKVSSQGRESETGPVLSGTEDEDTKRHKRNIHFKF